MHLVYKVLDSYPLPVTLPPELLPPTQESVRRGSSLSGAGNIMPTGTPSSENLKVRKVLYEIK